MDVGSVPDVGIVDKNEGSTVMTSTFRMDVDQGLGARGVVWTRHGHRYAQFTTHTHHNHNHNQNHNPRRRGAKKERSVVRTAEP